ncbi:hypothetical protein BGZ80_006646 [Entomortierella chlamydospora]|uniref:Uncharacterized protein n=1 Tax=Entomortierella chlamydospora TaxID=101097 RepID=A0A9P6T1X2_9FUNG|nr:hypothetical protein BGZ80_006646 [Entomortierella chlamydospora]
MQPQPTSSNQGEEQDDPSQDHRILIHELQRELRVAMLEIEKITKSSRELAKVNQELEESRFLAVSDQARTAKRLMLVSSQLEYTEQAMFNLTKEMGDGQKDSELLRIERIKREALQEREDAGRLKIEALQDELHEVQRSERSLQQKLLITQTKYEALGKRHEALRRQQQELDLVRESREALAWLKETTDRLCSPPQGSLGQAIQQEKAMQGSAPISIYQTSPSSSPPFSSAIMEPPLMAQNQLVSLIKELATANSTLRSELGEYRDLLQDSRNEVISLRAQVEDYEHGHGFECCGSGSVEDGSDGLMGPNSAFDTLATLETSMQQSKEHLDPHSGSPPPYMTTPAVQPTEQHLHHHFHLPGVRGNIFGELERRYNQEHSSKRKGRYSSRREAGERRSHRDHHGLSYSKHGHAPIIADIRSTATVSTSTSTSEQRPTLAPNSRPKFSSHLAANTKARSRNESDSRPTRNKSRKSLYTDADLDLLGSESEFGDYYRGGDENDVGDPTELLLDSGDSGSDNETGFVAKFAEALSSLSFFSGPLSGPSP